MQVDIVALNIPDYAEIIKKPMHLYAIADGLAVSFPFSVLPCLLGWFHLVGWVMIYILEVLTFKHT